MTANAPPVNATLRSSASNAAPAFAPAFAPRFPIRSLADVRRLEQTPLEQAVSVQSTYEIFRNSANEFGDRTALTFLKSGDPADAPIRWSYAELLRGIHQTANMLHALGVEPTDAIGVLLPACLEYHLALWGGEAAGIVQPLNPLLTDEKLLSLLRASGATVLIAYGADDESGIWSKAMWLRDRLPSLIAVLRVAPHNETKAPIASLPDRVADFNRLRAAQPDDRLVGDRRIAATDIAAYFHTGGTTGAPKLARHSHGAQVFTAWSSVMLTGIDQSDVMINGYPLFHVAGALPGSLASLSAGLNVVIPTPSLMRNRDVVANYWRLVETHRATILSAVPTVLAALANVPIGGADISSLRYCRTGAAPLSAELAERFKRVTGLHVHESLGMTEMAGISSITPLGVEGPAGCVGFPLPYSRVRIVALDASGNATERDLPPGEVGVVLFKSPNLFSGFVVDEDNAKAFTPDGWLVTGDLGFVDADGRLNLAGRSKDLIIRGGHNIDPKVVEDAIAAHPAVQHCAAVGAPDAYAGELPVAFVTLLPGASVTEGELLAFAAQRVDEAPARPKAITILERMPMTNVGKIYKPELRQLAAKTVVASIVAETCRALDVADTACPEVRADAEQGVSVRIDRTALGDASQRVQETLRTSLERLPIKVRLVSIPENQERESSIHR
jgi:fatty-acyl-CoA synthase